MKLKRRDQHKEGRKPLKGGEETQMEEVIACELALLCVCVCVCVRQRVRESRGKFHYQPPMVNTVFQVVFFPVLKPYS